MRSNTRISCPSTHSHAETTVPHVNGLVFTCHFSTRAVKALLYNMSHSLLHTHIHSSIFSMSKCFISIYHSHTFTLQWTHQKQLRFQYLTHGYFNMQTEADRNQTFNLLISRWSAKPPEPQLKLFQPTPHISVKGKASSFSPALAPWVVSITWTLGHTWDAHLHITALRVNPNHIVLHSLKNTLM